MIEFLVSGTMIEGWDYNFCCLLYLYQMYYTVICSSALPFSCLCISRQLPFEIWLPGSFMSKSIINSKGWDTTLNMLVLCVNFVTEGFKSVNLQLL